MLKEVKVNKLTGHSKSGKVGKVYIREDDDIKSGDDLLDVESNKGNITISSDFDGVIKEVKVDTGDEVNIGDVVALIEGEENSKKGSGKSSFSYMSGIMKPKKREVESDITIIGAGPGGYVAAIWAAKLGAKVSLIEKENIGGTCLNWGCIPTKAMVKSAEVFREMKESEKYGVLGENIRLDINKVIDRKNNIVKELVGGIEHLIDKNNIELFKGEGNIVNDKKIFVKTKKEEVTINTKNTIISTGSKTSIPPIKGVDSNNVFTSKEILDIDKLPDKLTIIGGGVIGMEFAFIFNNFGVDVTVIEYNDKVLSMLDDDVIDEIEGIAKKKGIKLLTNSKVKEVIDTEDNKIIISFDNSNCKKYITSDKVLVAVGRKPNIEGLGIEKLDIKTNKNNSIVVNERLQTNISNIYAVGDVTDIMQLAHVASHQGIVAVENILKGKKKMDYSVVPSAIFTDPEIATVGLTEKKAKKDNIDIEIGKFPYGANGKALTLGNREGFVKIIKEKKTNKILGASIIGVNGTDLIHELTLAIKNGLTDKDIIETIHAHPTTAETIHEAALGTTEYGFIHY